MRIKDIDTVSELASNDIIDSRDMEELIDTLTDEESAANDEDTPADEREPMDEDHKALLKALREVRDECSSEWKYGVGFIRESYFEEYAQDLADDIGAIQKEATWPNNFIDWAAAAEALKEDYSSTEIDGVTFYYRD